MKVYRKCYNISDTRISECVNTESRYWLLTHHSLKRYDLENDKFCDENAQVLCTPITAHMNHCLFKNFGSLHFYLSLHRRQTPKVASFTPKPTINKKRDKNGSVDNPLKFTSSKHFKRLHTSEGRVERLRWGTPELKLGAAYAMLQYDCFFNIRHSFFEFIPRICVLSGYHVCVDRA